MEFRGLGRGGRKCRENKLTLVCPSRAIWLCTRARVSLCSNSLALWLGDKGRVEE